MTTRVQFQAGRFSQLLYSSEDAFVGAVTKKGAYHLALDRDGKRLGRFATRREAIGAVLKARAAKVQNGGASIAEGEVVAIPRAPQIAAAPTWEHLTHQERHAWIRVLLAVPDLGALERERLSDVEAALRAEVYRPMHWRRVRLFDEKVAAAHARGALVEMTKVPASKADLLATAIEPGFTLQNQNLQAARLARRFRLAPSTAAVVAFLAFGEGAR